MGIARQRFERVILSPEFKADKDVAELEEKCFLFWDGAISSGKLKKQTALVLKKYNLPAHYETPLELYCLFGEQEFLSTHSHSLWGEGVNNLRVFRQEDKNFKKLCVEIFPETTIKDFQRCWPMIKEQQKKLMGYEGGRKKVSNNFKRDKRVFELAKLGIKHREIAKIIRNEFNINKSITYDDVAKMLLRFRRKMKNST